jgi:hypothetical protein
MELGRGCGAGREVPSGVRDPVLPENAPGRLRLFPNAVAHSVLLDECGDPADAMRVAHLDADRRGLAEGGYRSRQVHNGRGRQRQQKRRRQDEEDNYDNNRSHRSE